MYSCTGINKLQIFRWRQSTRKLMTQTSRKGTRVFFRGLFSWQCTNLLSRCKENGLCFRHKERRVDFILAWENKKDDPNAVDSESKRKIFQVRQFRKRSLIGLYEMTIFFILRVETWYRGRTVTSHCYCTSVVALLRGKN